MKDNKIRIVCTSCLHSKIMDRHESDLPQTRIIITHSCDQCAVESDGTVLYLNSNGNILNEDLTARLNT